MSHPEKAVSPISRGWNSVTKPIGDTLDNRQIAGRSLRWYLGGWRGGLIALVIAALVPTIVSTLIPDSAQTLISAGIQVGIYVLLALGLNIVVGYAGLLDLGYVAFFVIGSYTIAAGTDGIIQDTAGKVHTFTPLSLWPLLPIGAIIAGAFGVLLGAPTLRLRGDYLAIVTLGFGEIVPIIFQNVSFFFGPYGMTAVPPAPLQTPFGTFDFGNFIDHSAFYYLVLTIVALIVLLVIALRNSSLGRAWIAIREDELAASASGVNLVRTKLMAFGMGAAIGGLGGVLSGSFQAHVDPSGFTFGISISVLAMIVLGGIGSIPGVVVGAIALKFFDVYLLNQIDSTIRNSFLVAKGAPFHFLHGFDFNTAKYLIYGVVLLLIIVLRPQGLIPDRRRQRELKGEGVSAETLSVVGALANEEAGVTTSGVAVTDATEYTGTGSDAGGRGM